MDQREDKQIRRPGKNDMFIMMTDYDPPTKSYFITKQKCWSLNASRSSASAALTITTKI